MKIHIYMTVCCINNWESVMSHIYKTLKNSDLYHKINSIRCCIHAKDSNYKNHDFFKDSKVEIMKIFDKNLGNVFEKYTLDKLRKDSMKEDFYVLYLHSKGVSDRHQNKSDIKKNIEGWVDYLLYFNIGKYEYILDKLSHYDAIGVNLNGHSCKKYSKQYKNIHEFIHTNGGFTGALNTGIWPYHFSGNFWWSKSSYIKQICECEPHYPAAEIWVTNGNNGKIGRYLGLFNAHTDFYNIYYDKKKYVDKEFTIRDVKN
jgi:hypothetical protein